MKAEDLNVKIEELLGPFQWEENNLAYNNVKIEETSDETVPEHTIEPKNIKVSSVLSQFPIYSLQLVG